MIKFGVIFAYSSFQNRKMKSIKYIVLLILGVSVIFSCRKIEQLPPEPSISFISFAVFDTTDILGNVSKGGRLKFHFEDGDGDLGLDAPTTNQDDTTNLFLTLYRKKDGKMNVALPSDLLYPHSYRIPYMEKLGVNKILKGTISVTFLYLFYSNSDTIKYDFYIKDRALNVSNVVSTCEISLATNKIYTQK
jgi:hypothetical protein